MKYLNRIIIFFIIFFMTGCTYYKVLIKSDPTDAVVYQSSNIQGPWARIPSQYEKTPCYISISSNMANYLMKTKKYGYQDSEIVSVKDLFDKNEYMFILQEYKSNSVYDEFYGKSIMKVEGIINKENIGVMEFTILNDQKQIGYFTSEFIQDALMKTQVYNVVDRKNIIKILQEVKFQQSGVTDAEKAVEVGKILNLEKMVVGSIGTLGRYSIITFSILDVKTGQIFYSNNAKYEKEDDLNEAIIYLINGLVKAKFEQ